MKATRDFSKAQFDAAAEKYGFKPTGFMGYYNLPEPFSNTSVCKFNGGDRRRSQLAYLLAELAKREKK